MKILVYTFRTFPYLEELKKVFPEVVVFGKLKESLQDFYKLIVEKNPDLILGIALSNSGNSFFEPKTINQFNENAKVEKIGKDEFLLFVPNIKESYFKISPKPSDSFCNYTMYKIRNFLEQKDIDIPFTFSHLKKEQIKELPLVLNAQL